MLVACVVVGCAKTDDDHMKDMIAMIDEASGHLEGVKDKQSFDEAQKKLKAMEPRAKEFEKVTKAWSEDKKKEMSKKYETQMMASMKRYQAAVTNAILKSGGDKFDPGMFGGFK